MSKEGEARLQAIIERQIAVLARKLDTENQILDELEALANSVIRQETEES